MFAKLHRSCSTSLRPKFCAAPKPGDADSLPPFAFTGKLDKVTVKIDRPQLSPADIQKREVAMRDNEANE